jgi:iron complex outermembrane receptor protein
LQYSNEAFFNQKLRVQAFQQDFAGTYGAALTKTFEATYGGGETLDQSQNNSEKRGVKITLIKDQLAGAPVSLVYGVDIFEDETWQQLIMSGRAWVPPTRYENVAPYVQGEFTGIDRWILTAGVRREISKLKVDDFTTLPYYNGGQFVEGGEAEFSETLSNIGATFQIDDAWRLFANYSEGFSMPDVGRVLRGINVADQNVEAFLDLKPILTENQELGIDFSGEKFAAQLAYYRSDSDFGQRLNRGADGIYTVQREKTEIDGIEFRGQWFASDTDTLELRYAQADGRYDSDEDGRVDSDLDGANIAPNRANLSWQRNWSDRLSTRLQANLLLDRDFENNAGNTTAEFDGYTTFDLSAQLQALGGDFVLGLQNLSNEDYFTYHSQTVGNDIRNFKGLGRSVNLSYSRLF